MRNTTERPELLVNGAVRIVGTEYQDIVAVVTELCNDREVYDTMVNTENPVGSGTASEKIAAYFTLLAAGNDQLTKPENYQV